MESLSYDRFIELSALSATPLPAVFGDGRTGLCNHWDREHVLIDAYRGNDSEVVEVPFDQLFHLGGGALAVGWPGIIRAMSELSGRPGDRTPAPDLRIRRPRAELRPVRTGPVGDGRVLTRVELVCEESDARIDVVAEWSVPGPPEIEPIHYLGRDEPEYFSGRPRNLEVRELVRADGKPEELAAALRAAALLGGSEDLVTKALEPWRSYGFMQLP